MAGDRTTTAQHDGPDDGTAQPPLSGLRAALARPTARLLGTFVLIPRVEVVEIVAAAGFDVVVLDAEHGPFGVESLGPLIVAAQGRGLFAVVRVSELNRQLIGAVLDLGADGVLVPHVASAAQAEVAVRAARYPPAGTRSLHPMVRAGRYGTDPGYAGAADARSAVLVMCEDAQAVAEVEDVVRTAGLDALFVGPFDLSAALGYPGRPTEPQVEQTVRAVLAAADRAGLPGALMAVGPAAARDWFERGARLVLVGVDTGVLVDGYRAVAEAVRADPPSSG